VVDFQGLTLHSYQCKKMRGAPHGTPRTHHYTTNNYTPASRWSRVWI
jgi:hypothetical protein